MKKIRVNYFFMRNTHMKFQNPTIHRSKVNGRTHTQTDRQTHRQAKGNMPFQLFQSWGHNENNKVCITFVFVPLLLSSLDHLIMFIFTFELYYEKPAFSYAKTKTQMRCALLLNSAFSFVPWILQ